jgi:hypothetical protein
MLATTLEGSDQVEIKRQQGQGPSQFLAASVQQNKEQFFTWKKII